jgi:hypothetical protein
MTNIQTESCKIALNKMMEDGHFSICVIDQILKVTKGVPFAEDYETLRLLHCVDFKKFTPSMRIEFPNLLRKVLQSPSMEIEVKFKPLDPLPVLLLS